MLLKSEFIEYADGMYQKHDYTVTRRLELIIIRAAVLV